MDHITFLNNKLILSVGRSPWYTRALFFPTAFLFFLLPIGGIAVNLSEGNGISFMSVIALAIFCLLGFYLLRISLWNTFGKEIIEIDNAKITYTADYGWFKDKVQQISFEHLNCSIKQNDFDDKGILFFESENGRIASVIELPVLELEALLSNLNRVLFDKNSP